MIESAVQKTSSHPLSLSQGRALNVLKGSSSYLSAQFYPFLGHKQEVEAACALLRSPDTRLLTFTGTGGVGKTRLALRVAEELLRAFTDGIYFVPLAPVHDPTLVLPTIAQALELGELCRSNCPPVSRATIDLGPFALIASILPVDGVAATYVPRRTVLDKLLVDAAVKAGAELREGFSVQEVLMDGDRVTGISGRSVGGARVTEHASIIIGADGVRSRVARAVQAPIYQSKPVFACAYYSYWSGIPMEGIEFYPREHCTLFAFPTNDKLACVAMQRRSR